MGINVAYTWTPKFVSPFGDKKVYLVPSVRDQQGVDWNYIFVTCSPTYNGVYKYPAQNVKKYTKWKNGKLDCLYVPLDDCTRIQLLDELTVPAVIDKVAKTQDAWLKRAQPKKLPSWLIIKQLAE